MPDLDVAAAALQKQIEALQETVLLTLEHGERVKGAVDAARARVEERHAQVEARAVTLRGSVHERRQHVEGALQGFFDAAHQLGDDAAAAREQVTGVLEEAGSDLQALHEHVQGEIQPALEEALQGARAAHESFGERIGAMQEELGTLVTETHDFLTAETTQHLAELQGMVEQAHGELRALVHDELGPQIQQPVQDYLERLGALDEHLQDRILSSRQALQDGAAAALEEMMRQFTEHSDVAQQFAQQVDGVMTTLSESIDAGGEAVGEAKETVETGVDTAAAGLKAVVDTLEELRDFFSRFSFVSI